MTPSEAIEKQNQMTGEQQNFVAVRCSVAWYEQNRMKYKYNKEYMDEKPAEEEREA